MGSTTTATTTTCWAVLVAAELLVLTGAVDVPLHHVAGIFEVDNFTDYALYFNRALARETAAAGGPGMGVRMEALSLPAWSNAHDQLTYICDACRHHNITAFVAVGGQDLLNTLSIVTRYVGVPIVGYNTDTDKDYSSVRGERPLLLQMNPSKSLIAHAIFRVLESHHWFYASLITEDQDYATDGFVDTFKRLTSGPHWRLEDHIRLSSSLTEEAIDYKLLNLLENESRVIILHCSVKLARRVFAVALANGFTTGGYAWFITENVLSKNDAVLADYPVGLVAVTLDYSYNYKALLDETLALVTSATRRFGRDHGYLLQGLVRPKACFENPGRELMMAGDTFYRYMMNNSIHTPYGTVSFDPDGWRKEASFKMYNLVPKTGTGHGGDRKRWKFIGSYRNESFRVSTIVWPGESMSGPIARGERMLRVVTNVVEPFVMQQEAINGGCQTAVPCLRVQTKDKEALDDVFKDWARGVHDPRRPYDVRCCQGLSIMLLERLARDLNFHYQLYITADNRYGSPRPGPGGGWDGLVEDLQNGAAHMAVAAFSITRSRSRVIDFTDPYFFSGFSILVSERRRNTPIYAFMEPFDGWVWISIGVSATVVAFVLSMLEWRSPFGLNPWGRKRKTNYTLGSGLNMVYAILFGHTVKTKSPKAWPSKWLQNFWAGASIFIYSSYTANLAAFLAGKNSGVAITGIHDPKLMEPGRQIGVIQGNSVEEFVRRVNLQLLRKAQRYPTTLPTEAALGLLMNGTIDAYLDDTPVVEYARSTMDAKCQLRLVGNGFGEDAYGIGLPKNSWLKVPLSRKILEYHESGFMEDLKDLYFRRTKCNDQMNDWQLQGEARSMNFDQHAGLYLLLLVGIFMCIFLMFLEHATFKWMVPYWRKKPTQSFWKSLSMMFWSQRLYRIITSEELVSPHHSAREMIDMIKDRDFTKLFQKNVKKQERQARNRKNLFSIVEALQWKQMKEDLLNKPPGQAEETQPMTKKQRRESKAMLKLEKRRESQAGLCKSPRLPKGKGSLNSPFHKRDPHAGRSASVCMPLVEHSPIHLKNSRRSFTTQADVLKVADHDFPPSKSDDELLQPEPTDIELVPLEPPLALAQLAPLETEEEPVAGPSSTYSLSPPPASAPPASSSLNHYYNLMDLETPRGLGQDDPPSAAGTVFPSATSTMGLLAATATSSSEDNLISGGGCGVIDPQTLLPNGMVILSPNGDVFARSASTGKNIVVRPKTFANFKNFTTNLPRGMKTLPLKDNRVKSTIYNNRSRALEGIEDSSLKNDIDSSCLDDIKKEDLYMMWKTSEHELNMKLTKALLEKEELEKRLSKLEPGVGT